MTENLQLQEFIDSRLLDLSLSLINKTILNLNVYLPNYNDEFTLYMGRFSAILSDCEEENVCIIGNMNAHPSSSRFFFVETLKQSLLMWNIFCKIVVHI